MKHFRVSPEHKQRALSYYAEIATDYEATVNGGPLLRFFRSRERDAVLQLAKLDSTAKTLIDVGCGSGTWALTGKRAGLRTTAMDANSGMLEKLTSHVDETVLADIETWAPTTCYDRVICAGVLDFVLQPEVAFRNLCAAVAPGGRLVVLLPRTGLGGFYYRIEKSLIGVAVNLYRSDWLAAIAKDCGLTLVGALRPLPTNMALAFDRQKTDTPAIS